MKFQEVELEARECDICRTYQSELEALYSEKKIKDLECVNDMIVTSGLSANEVTEALESYARMKEQRVS